MLINLFIEAGWHTVPLKGELKRLDNGSKTVPVFEKEWRKKYTQEFNEKQVKLAGAITGACSGIIAIDCDNDLTYNLFKTFDPDYKFHFISKGKPSGGGTIIYSYTDTLGSFSLVNEEIKLDFYADEGFIYLPTEANYTKESWDGVEVLPEIKELPPAIYAILRTFKDKVPTNTVRTEPQTKHIVSNRLAPLLETFVNKKEYDPQLFKIITPKSFRDLPAYSKKGHLHPNDIPHGRGSEYLSKLSAILGADISVNVELYTNTMMLVNSLWDNPMDKTNLNKTIINPMIEEKATIDGEVIWQYDEYWDQMGFIATSINGDYIESFYDDVKGIYYIINYTKHYAKTFGDKRPALTTLKTLLGRSVTEVQYDTTKQIIRTYLNPSLEFGHVDGTDKFNLFRQTELLGIINNPAPYKEYYTRPTHILRYFESLIPDDFMRNYVLSFLKTKLTTFKYSPVVLYLIGKPGSGKDTLVNILREIIGHNYVAKPDTKVFLEQYNGWLMDKYIVQLDEYGNKLVRGAERQEALGKIKAYTGSEELQIRAMRQDGFNYQHSTTFIMTANSNPLPVEVDDRRFCFIKTPNKLKDQEWVREAGGITYVIEQIQKEIIDFCYYLGTEVTALKADDYVEPPETEDKERMILDNLPAAEQIIYYINNSQYEELISLAEEYGVFNITEGWEDNKFMDDRLQDLYEVMTEGAGSTRVLPKMMKGIGHGRRHTTKQGQNVFYYFIHDLHLYKQQETEFKPIDNIKPTTVKGL